MSEALEVELSEAQTTPSPTTEPPDARVFGTLERVVDGDTIIARIGGRRERVRYIGIDTPEIGRNGRRNEPFALAAKAANQRMLRAGSLTFELDVQERDRYGRLLAYVFADQGMVNELLLEQGFARLLTVPPNVRHVDRLRRLEGTARQKRLGLWGLSGPASSTRGG